MVKTNRFIHAGDYVMLSNGKIETCLSSRYERREIRIEKKEQLAEWLNAPQCQHVLTPVVKHNTVQQPVKRQAHRRAVHASDHHLWW